MCVHAGNEPSKFSAYPLSFLGLVFLIVVGWFVLFWFCPPPPPLITSHLFKIVSESGRVSQDASC